MTVNKQNYFALVPWRGMVFPIILILLWQLIYLAKIANPVFLPSVFSVIEQGHKLIVSGQLLEGLAASLYRDLVGLSIAIILGVTIGVALGLFRLADKVFLPTFNTIKQISPFALIPLLSFWFGLHESAKIAFIVVSSIFPIMINTYEGVRGVALEYVEIGRVYKMTTFQFLRRVILPAATPSIFRGLHLGVFFSWLGTVGAEYFFAAGAGLGNIIVDGRNSSRMDLVLFGVFVIGVTGYLLNIGLSYVEKRLLHWQIQKQ